MPELEIHHEHGHDPDPTGQKVGILAAVLAVGLAIVTIASHRAHTAAIIFKSTANDEWSYYQATRVKFHNVELGEQLVTVFGAKSDSAEKMLASYATQKKKYDQQGKETQDQAQGAEASSKAAEERALRFDIGEGLLEIGLVLSSLYFISKKMMFPVMGVVAGLIGAAVALTVLLL
jgi:hypothetical protein